MKPVLFGWQKAYLCLTGKRSCAIVYTAGGIENKVRAVCLKKQVFWGEIKEIYALCLS